MKAGDVRAFADKWIEAWNARDLDRILGQDAPDVVFTSPVAERVTGSGRVVSAAALRRYWSAALPMAPDLRFTLETVLAGHQCCTLVHLNQKGQRVAETCEFDAAGGVVRSTACYAA